MVKVLGALILLLTLILTAIPVSVDADVPRVVSYQGRLTDSAGDPVVDGQYLIKFKMYGSEFGDDSLWWSGYQTVTITNGLFDYQLGSSNPIPADFFGPGSEPFLGITIGANPEVTPRTKITSSAFSWHSNTSDTAAYATEIADDIETESKLSNYAVTSMKIGDNSINTSKIQDGTIDFNDIGINGASSGEVMKMLDGS